MVAVADFLIAVVEVEDLPLHSQATSEILPKPVPYRIQFQGFGAGQRGTRSRERGRRDLRGFRAVKVPESYKNIQLEGRERFEHFVF